MRSTTSHMRNILDCISKATSVAIFTVALSTHQIKAFQVAVPAFSQELYRQQHGRYIVLHSSVGDGPPSKPPSDDDENDNWGDFLNGNESENLRKARDFMSEQSLPISFDETADETDEEVLEDFEGLNGSATPEGNQEEEESEEVMRANGDGVSLESSLESALVFPSLEDSAEATFANNPYLAVVTKLSPSELISKFTATANPRVQDAVRSTILGLIGGLPKLAFETTTITTGQRLASLMFQLQMTGYMFKNAEYRLSLQQSLGISSFADSKSSQLLLTGIDEEEENDDPLLGKVRGKIKLHYKPSNLLDGDASSADDDDGDEDTNSIEVDAAAYMSELRDEVSKLRDELTSTRQEKEEALRKDLLLYIRTLPEQQLQSLTNTMSQDVLVAMKGLVNAVLSGIGEGKLGPETVTEQSGEAMAQLCMWQLVVGYNLRELEVREEMKNSLFNSFMDEKSESSFDEGGVDFSDPGALE